MLRCCQDAVSKVGHDFSAALAESSGKDDHVHLLAGYPPKVAISALVNSLKGVPTCRFTRPEFTGRVNQHIMHRHLWSPSHLAVSSGGAPVSTIRKYTEQQRWPVNAASGPAPP